MISSPRMAFPEVWDNSMRKHWASCPQKCAWEYFDHWKPGQSSIHLHAGRAWAAALETARLAYYAENALSENAIALGAARLIQEYGDFSCPEDSPKSLDRLLAAFDYYFTAFPFERDPVQPYIGHSGRPMVEFSFVLPLDSNLVHPETGNPILYSGRSDMVATYAGALSIYDDKTTSKLGKNWSHQWDTASQFTGYIWAAQNSPGLPHISQVLVRGIAILKTDFNHQQHITHRAPWQISEWHAIICEEISDAIHQWKRGWFRKNLSDSCASFGSCIFREPCLSREPENWLSTGFTRRVWDPVNRTEMESKNAQ